MDPTDTLIGQEAQNPPDEAEQKQKNLEEFKALVNKLETVLRNMEDDSLSALAAMINIERARRATQRLGILHGKL